jgi:hypothetical protein
VPAASLGTCLAWLFLKGSTANKPKALSTGTTVELGTKTRSWCRAVLVSAKTMPCANKSGPLPVTLAASVHLNGHVWDTTATLWL